MIVSAMLKAMASSHVLNEHRQIATTRSWFNCPIHSFDGRNFPVRHNCHTAVAFGGFAVPRCDGEHLAIDLSLALRDLNYRNNARQLDH
jgi:hypothetical protein